MKKGKQIQTKSISGDDISFYVFFIFLIIVLPFVYVNNVLDSTLIPRLFALSTFLFAFTIFFFAKGSQSLLKKNNFDELYVFWFIIAYLLISNLSVFQAINVKETFFDIAKTSLFASVIIFTFLFAKKVNQSYSRISQFIAIAIIGSLTIGYYEYYTDVILTGNKPLDNGLEAVYGVTAIFSHKNLYSSYLFLTLPFQIYGILVTRTYWKWSFVALFLLTLLMIILLKTRAVWLALIVATGVSLAMIIFKGEIFSISKKLRLRIAIVSVFILFLGLIVISQSESSGRFSVVERLKSITNPKDSDNIFRLKIWEISTKMSADYPVLGVGPGNWKLKLGDYVHDYGFNEKQINWTRPHNDFLWILTEKGYPGLFAYLGILIISIIYTLRVFTKSGNKNDQILSLLLLSGIVGYSVIAFFDFPGERIDHQVFLGIYIGIISLIYSTTNKFERKSGSIPFFFITFLLIFAFVIFSTVYSFSAFRQEQKVYQLREAKARKNWKRMLELSENLSYSFRNLDPEALPVHYYPGFAYLQLNDFKNAKIQYEEALKDHPNNIQVINDLGVANIKSGRNEEAKVFFEKALFIVPEYPSALKNLSSYYGLKGDYQQSYEIALKIPENLRDKEVQDRIKFLEKAIKSKK